MLIVPQSCEVVEVFGSSELLEKVARTCYKSEIKAAPGTASKVVKTLRKNGHHAMLEFGGMVVKFVTNRGVTHEIVRHRLCSFAQESTRFCNYASGAFSGQVTYCLPADLPLEGPDFEIWTQDCQANEQAYLRRIALGWNPGKARGILANDTKTEINVYANFREWQHIFDLRSLGTTGKPHPDMKALVTPLRLWAEANLPDIFGPLTEEERDG